MFKKVWNTVKVVFSKVMEWHDDYQYSFSKYVDSTNLSYVTYQYKAKLLMITFSRGDRYIYKEVPYEKALGLITASSIGKYFHSYINNKFETKKVG